MPTRMTIATRVPPYDNAAVLEACGTESIVALGGEYGFSASFIERDLDVQTNGPIHPATGWTTISQ